MNTYAIYVKAIDRLCDEKPGMADAARFNDRLRRMYNKIRKSQLTVYQKEYLLEQLDRARLAAMNSSKKHTGKRHSSELLAA